ncbi:MAG: quinolinate synthase NadA [Planctomycetota bacterium]
MNFRSFPSTVLKMAPTGFVLEPEVDICQSDYPLDWYQAEFVPYAREYQALPDRRPETVVPWMRKYLDPAQKQFGDSLLLLAHYYMGGEIVKLVELFGGKVADSYQLALMAHENPDRGLIVESAVHFMAETIAILAHPHQRVYITNPKSGCTMEMLAKDYMVAPALDALNSRYGAAEVLPVCYMNTSGRVKALAGAQGGAVCTSSNVEAIFRWALVQKKKIFFVPDRHMGENVAARVGIGPDEIAHWPGGAKSASFSLEQLPSQERERFDRARLVLFGSECGVHTIFEPWMANYWRAQGYSVFVHPECPKIVVDAADGFGSTSFLWDQVTRDRAGTRRYAIGTEAHFVSNLQVVARRNGIEVVHLSAAPPRDGQAPSRGCGCATMSRNDPPHLVALIDLLRQGRAPDYNEVMPGDVVNEFTGSRERLDAAGRAWLVENARRALINMIEITKAAES